MYPPAREEPLVVRVNVDDPDPPESTRVSTTGEGTTAARVKDRVGGTRGAPKVAIRRAWRWVPLLAAAFATSWVANDMPLGVVEKPGGRGGHPV